MDNLVFLSCYNIKVRSIVNALRVPQCHLQIKFNPYNIYYPQLFSERFLRNTFKALKKLPPRKNKMLGSRKQEILCK